MNQHIITVAALGPDDGGMLTFAAYEAMERAGHLVLRTERHGVADMLKARGVAFTTLDALYEQTEDFDELCAYAAKRLIAMAREHGGLCYAVSEPVSDATVRTLAKNLPQDLALQVIGGVPLAANAAAAALAYGVDTENLRTLTALSLEEHRPEGDCPQVITEIDNRYLASDVKLWLSDLFEDEMTVYFLPDASRPGCQAEPILLCDLDRQDHYDHRTAVLVPAVSVYERSRASYEDFVKVISRLRAPGGCPWDRAQTFHTLRQYMIEEACEAAEAMDGENTDKIADELGDVLLQVVLNSCIGAEHRDFTDRDVTSMAAHKMITRHEHVFGKAKADSANAVVAVWESVKKKERGEQSALERIKEVPASLPALMRAQKSMRRLAQSRGEKPEVSALAAKALEAAQRLGEKDAGEAAVSDVLMRICALADAMGLDAECALRGGVMRLIAQLEQGNA